MASPNKKRPETWAKRFALNLKTTEDIRQKVEERAQKSGRSITLEVEQQLIKSFEIEEKDALNEEIKAEMRGTIAALEQQIAISKKIDGLLWPDVEARALGEVFARALGAVRHAFGSDWRRDAAFSLILAGVVRRLVDRVTQTGVGGSMATELFERQWIAAMADSVAKTIGPDLDKAMPPLPAPVLDLAQWTGRARLVTEWRDAATGEVLETVTGPEWDAADPEQRPSFGKGYDAALDRFTPRRHEVNTETFTAYDMKDGTTERVSLDITPAFSDPAVIVLKHETPGVDANYEPARGQLPASIGARAMWDYVNGPARNGEAHFEVDGSDEPPLALTGQEEATRLTAHDKRSPGVLPPELGDRAEFDRAMGPERPDEEPPEPEAQPAPKRRGRSKAKVTA